MAPGEPSPNGSVATSQFIARAQQSTCAETSNRLFVIDQKYVFAERRGNCADASYSYELFGATPDIKLCSRGDSIAGPQTVCTDTSVKPLLETIVANLSAPDLGLGGAHKVEQLSVPAKDGSALAITGVAAESFSSVQTARQVVVKDQAAFAALWAEHTSGRPQAPAMPMVDFSAQMVVAVFAGNSGACNHFGIRRIVANSGKLMVQLEDRLPDPAVACLAVVTSPMQMVTVARSAMPVEFVNMGGERLPTERIDGGGFTAITERTQYVVKDAALWGAIWKTHNANLPAPAVDFSKKMVIAVFAGPKPGGCHGVGLEGVFRSNSRLSVSLVETVPGPAMLCTMAIVFPYVMVTVDRSDLPVEYWWRNEQLR